MGRNRRRFFDQVEKAATKRGGGSSGAFDLHGEQQVSERAQTSLRANNAPLGQRGNVRVPRAQTTVKHMVALEFPAFMFRAPAPQAF